MCELDLQRYMLPGHVINKGKLLLLDSFTVRKLTTGVRVAKKLALSTSNHEVIGSKSTESWIQTKPFHYILFIVNNVESEVKH